MSATIVPRPEPASAQRGEEEHQLSDEEIVTTVNRAAEIAGVPSPIRQINTMEETSLTENENRFVALYGSMLNPMENPQDQDRPSAPQTATEAMVAGNGTRGLGRYGGEVGNLATFGDLLTKEPTEKPIEIPEDKEWKRLYKSKKPIEDKVSHIIAHASYTRLRDASDSLDKQENARRNLLKAIRDGVKKEKEIKGNIKELKKRKRELEQETPKQRKQRALINIHHVLSLLHVKSIQIDERKRIVITTNPIDIKKDYWDKPRDSGSYQIIIDFYSIGIDEGVRVLNVTKRFEHYDHPCINNTKVCWGNIAEDIINDFRDRDLLELVVDMLLFISSPNDEHGFLTYSKKDANETKKQGWEQFLEFSQPLPKGYTIWKYEEDEKKRNEEQLPEGTLTIDTRGNQFISINPNLITQIQAPEPPENPLILERDDFRTRLTTYLSRLIEFRNPEIAEEFSYVIKRQLETEHILFLERISLSDFRNAIEFDGWTLDGTRRNRLAIDITIMRPREDQAQSILFRSPDAFNRRQSLQFYPYRVGSETVTMYSSSSTNPLATI